MNGIVFHKDWSQSPLYKMLTEEEKLKISDGTLIWFTDASHGDCDQGRSTLAYMGFFQGGLVDMNSFVAQPVPHSTAELETMAIGLGAMAYSYARQAIADVLFDDDTKPWTVPFLSDSQAAIAMNESEKPTKRNKHIDKRYFFGRQEKMSSNVDYMYVDTTRCMPDVAT